MIELRATPFHVRAAALNRSNGWIARNSATLAICYSDIADEALAARARVAVADISWRWRVAFEGPRASEFLSRLLTRDSAQLVPGIAFKALWLSDGGGVRGAGALARYGRESFRLVSAASDSEWIRRAALQFDVRTRDTTTEEGGLAIVGPCAKALLSGAGLEPDLERLAFRRQFWRGLDVTISRWGEHGGYELWCGADDCVALWDRIMRAGAPFGIQPVGLAAMDILDVEAGIARPWRDWQPAGDALAQAPTPASLSLESLIDESHNDFNARAAWLNARAKETHKLVAIELDSLTPAPHTLLTANGQPVGRTYSSFYSPSLRRAIALAQIETAMLDVPLSLTVPATFEDPALRTVMARVVKAPLLPPVEQLAPRS
ncbi:MAG TPA: glycine cleavage T C-terminal barrel domain-containing protein [Rhizomicrobium sp.]